MAQRRITSVQVHRTTGDVVIAEALADRHVQLDAGIAALSRSPGPIAEAAGLIVDALRAGHKVLIAGNGGSAAQAQHFAGELVGRFLCDRSPYAAIALTTDTAILTAIGNDYGYDDVFARQVRGLGQAGDVLVALSTSGESENLIRAAAAAHRSGIAVIALTGGSPSRLSRLADIAILAPGAGTPVVQELHMLVVHVICGVVEAELCREAERV